MEITHGGDVFAIAREQGWDWRDVLDFSASINPLGPSSRVCPAICKALEKIVHYPEREPTRLREALGRAWNVTPDQVLLGNGATELIFFAARLFKSVTLALPVFSEFHRAFPDAGTCDLLQAGTWPRDGLLVLTRPANPTGWTLPLSSLRAYLANSEASALIDESFLEFSGHVSSATLLDQYPNLFVLRSLTKFYALPGLRVGALIGNVGPWRARREPWQTSVLAEEAALAALSDTDHAARSIQFVAEERAFLSKQLGALPSDANFLFVPVSNAAKLRDHLFQRKILIRTSEDWVGVRVAVRTRTENERLLQAWREFRP